MSSECQAGRAVCGAGARLVGLGCVLATCSLLACSGEPGRAAGERTATGVGQAASEGPARKAVPPPAEPPPYKPPPGFRELSVENAMPACVFPDVETWFKAKLLKDVGEQRLEAGKSVVIGVFGPWCVHERCDQRPSLQCKVEQQGEQLVVSSRYWGEHKDGAICTTDCRSITASCETPPLPAGEYTIRHGTESFSLKIPSRVREPCFGSEHPPPPPPAPPAP